MLPIKRHAGETFSVSDDCVEGLAHIFRTASRERIFEALTFTRNDFDRACDRLANQGFLRAPRLFEQGSQSFSATQAAFRLRPSTRTSLVVTSTSGQTSAGPQPDSFVPANPHDYESALNNNNLINVQCIPARYSRADIVRILASVVGRPALEIYWPVGDANMTPAWCHIAVPWENKVRRRGEAVIKTRRAVADDLNSFRFPDFNDGFVAFRLSRSSYLPQIDYRYSGTYAIIPQQPQPLSTPASQHPLPHSQVTADHERRDNVSTINPSTNQSSTPVNAKVTKDDDKD
ncbi:hypothetical protein F5Y18DRAFT_442388 [Xylariaceae sp. FL1019]|nr:hypothetical protein F5Y18DRAFT_442388 [Xylariaceae sp. FL1019]